MLYFVEREDGDRTRETFDTLEEAKRFARKKSVNFHWRTRNPLSFHVIHDGQIVYTTAPWTTEGGTD